MPNKLILTNEWKRVGLHEAGHYVVARFLGYSAGPCKFDSKKQTAHCEITLWRGFKSIDDVCEHLENRIQILFAGVLAQSFNSNGIDNAAACAAAKGPQGQSDYSKATEMLQIIRNIKHPDTSDEPLIKVELNTICKELWTKASEVVFAEREIIEQLGEYFALVAQVADGDVEMSKNQIMKMDAVAARFGA